MAEVLLLNPRRRRRTRKAKATTKRRRRRRVSHARAMHHNPRRHRRVRARRHNPRRRRRVRRNPSLGGGGNMLMKGAGIAAGALAVEALANALASKLPDSWKANPDMVRIGSKAAIAIGAPLILKKIRVLPHGVANAIAIGGAVAVALDALRTWVAPHVPFLHGYEAGMLTGYEDGTITGADDAPQIGESAYGQSAY